MSEVQETPQYTANGLCMAAYTGDLITVQKSIDAGVNPNEYNEQSMPAITCAACYNYLDIAEYLLTHGADVNNYTNNRLSALKSAAKSKYTEMIKLLLKHGADPDYEKDGNVALTIACDGATEEHKELIETLLKVTDKKYYQKAYENCHLESLRQFIKDNAPDMKFNEPINGFGGENYKQDELYNTPPKHKKYMQLWLLLSVYECLETNPNQVFPAVMYKTSMMVNKEIYKEDCDQNMEGPYIDDFCAGICNWVFEKMPSYKELCKDIYEQVKDNQDVDVTNYI